MEYFAMIGLLFAPVVCLLCTGWFFVRWKNEHEDEAKAQKSRRICRGFLIATVASLVVAADCICCSRLRRKLSGQGTDACDEPPLKSA